MTASQWLQSRSLVRIPSLPVRTWLAVFFALGSMLSSAAGPSEGNPLAAKEKSARRVALSILGDLKPIEGWVEVAPGEPKGIAELREVVEVTGSRVNMRSGPTTESSIMTVGTQGEVFEYLITDGDWYQVRLDDGREAYISARFSKLSTVEEGRTADSAVRERISPGFETKAAEILRNNRASLAALERLARSSEDTFKRLYGDTPPAAGDSEHAAAQKSIHRIRKYHRRVTKKYNRYANMLGDDGEPAPRLAGSGWTHKVRGRISAGLGTNTATVESGDNKDETDVTRSELKADLTADLSPNDKIALNLMHAEEIRFAPSSQTRAGIDYTRRVGSKGRMGARAGLDKYKNDLDDTTDIDRTEFGFSGQFEASPQLRMNGSLDMVSASHPNNEAADYADTRISLGAGGNASESVTWGVNYGQTKHDIDDNTIVDDNTRSRIDGNLNFKTGERTTVSVLAHSEDYSFDTDNHPGSYTKRGVKLQRRARSQPGNSSTSAIEVRMRDHEADEDRNYTEIRGELRNNRRSDDDRERSSTFSANFRNYKGKANIAYLDYIEARFDSRGTGKGTFWESNNYAQGFIKSDEIERNPLLRQFFWVGLRLGQNGAVEVGPHAALSTEIVTIEGQTDAEGNELNAFESESNSARYGVTGSVRVNAHPMQVSGRARWEKTDFYNVENSATPTRVELEGDAIYEITDAVDASVRMKYYSTEVDDTTSMKSSEIDILFGLVYRIGSRR